jgi:hypothetical protein
MTENIVTFAKPADSSLNGAPGDKECSNDSNVRYLSQLNAGLYTGNVTIKPKMINFPL